MSGLKVVFSVTDDNAGSRVTSLKVKSEADGDAYEDVEDAKKYNVAMPSFLANSTKM